MNQALYFDEVSVGQTWVSGARTVTETDVVLFAGLTGDYNPLHVDHEFAKNTPYRRPIAHGLLGTALVAGLGSFAPFMKTEAFLSVQNWRFLQPLLIGDTVHVHTELVEKVDTGRRRGKCLWKRDLINQEGKVVQSGFFESIVAKRNAKAPSDTDADSPAGIDRQ
jgi:acyl dehydratase